MKHYAKKAQQHVDWPTYNVTIYNKFDHTKRIYAVRAMSHRAAAAKAISKAGGEFAHQIALVELVR